MQSRTVDRGAATLGALLIWASLAACGKRPDKVLARVKLTGKVTFGYRVDARPFSFRDEAGRPTGYSIDLCNSVVRLMSAELDTPSLQVEWVPLTIDDWSDAVAKHRVDLYCSVVTETLDRRKAVDYSVPIFPGGVAAVVRADAPAALKHILEGTANVDGHPARRATALDIVRGQKLAVVKGTTADQWLAQQRTDLKLDSEIITVENYADGVQAVLDRRVNVFFGQIAVLREMVKQRGDAAQLTTIQRMFTYEPVALAMPRDDDDFRLLVDRALSERFGSADFWATYTRWFGMPEVTDVVFYLWNTLPS